MSPLRSTSGPILPNQEPVLVPEIKCGKYSSRQRLTYRIRFRLNGRNVNRSLKTSDKRRAVTLCSRIEETLDLISRRRVEADRMEQRQNHNAELLRQAQQKLTSERNRALSEYRQEQQERKRKQTLQQKIQRDFDEAAKREEIEKSKDDTDRTEQGGGSSQQTVVQPKRQRKPRDPEKSRRKRDIAKREHEADTKQPESNQLPLTESDADFDSRMRDQMASRFREQDHDLDR